MTVQLLIGVHTLIGVIALGAFLVVFYWPWQAVWADIARQLVFEKRDSIFDLAQSGRISFNSREYRTVRAALEQIIRFAHQATAPRILLGGFYIWWRGNLPSQSPIENVIEQIDDVETREAIRALMKSALRAVAITMAFRSLPVVLLFPLTIAAVCVLALCRNAGRALGKLVGIVILVESAAGPVDGRARPATA